MLKGVKEELDRIMQDGREEYPYEELVERIREKENISREDASRRLGLFLMLPSIENITERTAWAVYEHYLEPTSLHKQRKDNKEP